MCVMPCGEKKYLTLGDGDFSYSLDLCRFLAASLAAAPTAEDGRGIESTNDDTLSDASNEFAAGKNRHSSTGSRKRDRRDGEEAAFSSTVAVSTYKICCTGIDSLPELSSKYNDADFILRKIHKLDQGTGLKDKRREIKKAKFTSGSTCFDSKGDFRVDVCHEVNAIVGNNSNISDKLLESLPFSCGFDHVVFNHPHLGTESASLHTRFLSHLFHSAMNHWMSNPGGVLHLTLAKGQVERWKCLETAERMGLTLLHRGAFRPPPPPICVLHDKSALDDKKKLKNLCTTYYQHRRHQCGRSFASRATGGSETVTLGRLADRGMLGTKEAVTLPWQLLPESDSSFGCPHCSKIFKEERACKDHIRGVHSGSKECSSDPGKFECDLCRSYRGMQEESRTFVSAQALADHKRAKHSGPHTDIKPDWFERSNCRSSASDKKVCSNASYDVVEENVETSFGKCSICNQTFTNETESASHLNQFKPQKTDGSAVKLSFRCSGCSKGFREKRAQMQHENFCSAVKSNNSL